MKSCMYGRYSVILHLLYDAVIMGTSTPFRISTWTSNNSGGLPGLYVFAIKL